MKHFVTRFIIFLSIFFIIEKASWYFINNAADKEYDKRLEKVVKGEFNKDLIILGSSRGANNILACQLETETGLRSYNFSYRGADILFQEFILKTYLKFNKTPKKLLLFLDHKYTFKKEKTLSFRFDCLFPLSKYNYINNELINHNKKSYASKFFGLLRVSREDFDLKKKKIWPISILTDCGSMPNEERVLGNLSFIEDLEIYKKNDEQDEKIKAFKRIENFCKHHDIQLISVFSPNYKTFNSSFLKRFKALKNTGNLVMVFDTLNPIYNNEKIYSDQSHLFIDGAEIFTSEISAFINRNKDNTK